MTKKQVQLESQEQAKPAISGAIEGIVKSSKMNKTIVVQIMRMVKHKLYGKYMRHYSKMYVHDEANQCREGDVVKIKQSRPISKTKRWVLVELVRRAEQGLATEADNAA